MTRNTRHLLEWILVAAILMVVFTVMVRCETSDKTHVEVKSERRAA